MIHLANPQLWSVVIIIFTHNVVRLSVLFQLLHNKTIYVKIMNTIDVTVDPAERIIDDTCILVSLSLQVG